jgi:transposase
MNRQPFALFLDGAGPHRSIVLNQRLEEINVKRILNVGYSPQFNPIEGCFSIVKNHFKRKRTNAMLN